MYYHIPCIANETPKLTEVIMRLVREKLPIKEEATEDATESLGAVDADRPSPNPLDNLGPQQSRYMYTECAGVGKELDPAVNPSVAQRWAQGRTSGTLRSSMR